jgi:hypothetical protein
MPADSKARARTLIGVAALVALVAAIVLGTLPALASHEISQHVKGTFPNHGFLWLDDLKGSWSGDTLYVYSDRCKSSEASAWAKIGAQLAGGATEFRGAWPGGVRFSAAKCTATSDNLTDIMLDYKTSSEWYASADHGNYGGHHHYSLADSSWCALMDARYPCGYHISRIHINEPRFDGYSFAYQVGFFLHETGHSMGFYDYCGHTSVANNGLYCALAGNWYSLDRKMLRDVIYKNSPVYTHRLQ